MLIDISRFSCQNLQFCWSQTSHTKLSDEILKPFYWKGFSKQLNELNDLRDQAYENSLIYKEWTKKLHDDKINNRIFNVGDQVLLFNSRLKIFSGLSPERLKTSGVGYCPGFQDPHIR
nr:reverse transcriptase domain-containing protein [Tanacetum cinerariifolium]